MGLLLGLTRGVALVGIATATVWYGMLWFPDKYAFSIAVFIAGFGAMVTLESIWIRLFKGAGLYLPETPLDQAGNEETQAERIGLKEPRFSHSLSVARIMHELACDQEPNNPQYAEDMYVLGLLHDIGYEFATRQEDHPDLGGQVLKRQGYRYWQEGANHGNPDAPYWSEELRLLNTADLMTDPHGNRVTVTERLNDIAKRYGENSVQYREAHRLAVKLNLLDTADGP